MKACRWGYKVLLLSLDEYLSLARLTLMQTVNTLRFYWWYFWALRTINGRFKRLAWFEYRARNRNFCCRGQHRLLGQFATSDTERFATASRENRRCGINVRNVCSYLITLLSEWFGCYRLVAVCRLKKSKLPIFEKMQLPRSFEIDLGFFNSSSTQFNQGLEEIRQDSTNRFFL
jgi:hypothetical protein